MPLFISDEEYQRCCNDAGLLVEKADAFVRELYNELETVKAQADAASTTAEQTCSLLEQKYVSLASDYAKLESENAQLNIAVEQRLSELAQVQAEKHQLHLNSIGKDGEFERLMAEVSEHQKAKRQIIQLVEQKELEISEKNAMIKTYLDKIVRLTETVALKEGKLNDVETDLQRMKANCARHSQEKELIERHNIWLNDELTAKVNILIETRSAHSEFEAEMSAKLVEVERQFGESSKSLKWHKERVRELEKKLGSVEEELLVSKSSASNDEERFAAEIATVNKLVELYKERSEELSKKAGELEGVIQALETHLSQVENDNKEKIEKEISAHKELEKENAALREKLEKCEAEVEAGRKTNELTLQLSDFTTDMHLGSSENSNLCEDSQMIVPKVPAGVSGTALAASLLREGWSLTKMYCKYQEAVDALRHEQLGRKNVEALLQRILQELEEKAEAILDERAEHERILDAYSMINEKLQHSLSEKANLDKTIQGLQAEIRRKERDFVGAQRDIVDLQKQVTLLLKDCHDVQLRCGLSDSSNSSNLVATDNELMFNDINGLVTQNVQLRSLVRKLSEEVENREMDLKEKFDVEVRKHTEEAASRITAVIQRAEEQAQMIESLHTSVAMYKKLYEEEQKWRSSSHIATVAPEGRTSDIVPFSEGSHTTSRKAQEQSDERAKYLEEELSKIRSEVLSIRNDRDKLALEANFARGRLESFMKEFEHQREESNGILARNIEFSQIIVDYQKKIRESSDALHAAEDLSRKLTMEVSILKHEKEMLSNSEKRACDEVRSLSERVHRLQASLDTIHSADEVREEARIMGIKKQEEHIQMIEREWAEAKKELQEERDNSRTLALDREEVVKTAMKQVEETGKEVSDALRAVAAAEARAAVAEARYLDLEKSIRPTEKMAMVVSSSDDPPANSSEVTDLHSAIEEIEKLKGEIQATKDHMMQYKNIAQVNETALKQMEAAHEEYKTEAEKLKSSLEAEISSLQDRICHLENECVLRSKEAASASSGKEEALECATAEISRLKHECSAKISENEQMEVRVSALKDDLEREHQRWVTAQANYERQVILQSETIQELTKTSKALSLLQEEASELRRVSDALKSENIELKRTWEDERVILEELKSGAEKKYNEINEQNKILHSRLEALHIQLAERDRNSTKTSSESSATDTSGDSGMQSVLSYLRRSKEIAETEISLLKQEKLRLQSQLESALKAAEAAQASLQAERSSSRALLLSEDEIKSLQLQVREMNLLRESNMQLREENKHNFEECQKLREAAQRNKTDLVRMQSLVMEKDNEIGTCRREIETYMTENSLLEKKATELLQNCENIDVNEYNRVMEEVKRMQVEKQMQLEENKKLVCEKEDLICRLEQDLANSTAELKEKENKINEISQMEATMKSDLERQKKLVAQLKRQCELFSKQKEELNRVNTALQKQLHEQKGKGPGGDVTTDQALKEKQEKDTRIQSLEKTLERHRDELSKRREENRLEKTKRTKIEKVVMDVTNRATQEKIKFVDELDKHKQALKSLLLDVEKAKQSNNISLEGNPSLQLLNTNTLDESAASFLGTCADLEKVAQSVVVDFGGSHLQTTTATAGPTSSVLSSAVPPNVVSLPGPSAIQSPIKTNEEKERKVTLPKPSGEARRPGRRLVRPRLVKQEEPQGDAEMPEVDGTSCALNQASVKDTETRSSSPLVEQPARKRHAASLSEQAEVSVALGETADVSLPVSKKSKGSDTNIEPPTEKLSSMETYDAIPAIDDQFDIAAYLTQEAMDELVDDLKDDDALAVDEVQAVEERSEHSHQEGTIQADTQNAAYNVAEESDKQDETDMAITDDTQKYPEEMLPLAESDKEEGELDSDGADPDGGGEMYNQGSPQIGEGLPETIENVTSPATEAMDESLIVALEADDDNLPDVEDRGPEGDEVCEMSNKSNDGNDNEQVSREISAAATTSTAGPETTPKVASNTVTEAEDLKQTVPPSGSTTINLNERARIMSQRRQAGMISTAVSRGTGRVAVRGRALRGRTIRGRGQMPPGDQS
uniref:Nucleoprotein TPR/MLP1 domain-containing protein n=1 Tax=Kalanchoe fedtschenkoi TaxID=63787 RepID=A0A7N0VHG9_KALFE